MNVEFVLCFMIVMLVVTTCLILIYKLLTATEPMDMRCKYNTKERICKNCKYIDRNIFTDASYCKKHKFYLTDKEVIIQKSYCCYWLPSKKFLKDIKNEKQRKKYLLFINEKEK